MLVGRQAANRHEFSDSRQRGHVSKNCHSDPECSGEGPPSIRLQTKELHDCNDRTMYEIGFAELRFAPVARSVTNLRISGNRVIF